MEIWEWLLIVLVLALTVAVIMLGVLAIIRPTTSTLNQSCSTLPCQEGLICNEEKLCKQEIGGTCSTSADCIGENSQCINNICVANPDNKCPCKASFVCDITTNTCKVPVGGQCTNSNSCVSEATLGCVNGICTEGVSTTPVSSTCQDSTNGCIVPLNGACSLDSDCGPNAICSNNICVVAPTLGEPCTSDNRCANNLRCQRNLLLYLNGNIIFPSLADSILDVVSYKTEDNSNNIKYIFLLENGNILIMENGKYRLRHSTVNLNRILIFGKLLLGLDNNGRLYQRLLNYVDDINNPNFRTWTWKASSWAPQDINHITTTLDNNNLWIQSYKYNNTNRGYLYDYNTDNIKLIRNIPIGNIRRIFGNNINTYIDINPNNTAIRYPNGEMIQDIVDGLLMENGELIRVTPDQSNNIRHIRIIRTPSNKIIAVIITTRQCVSQ